MKISFTTLSCPDWTWNKILDESIRLGYDGIEIRGIEGEMVLTKAHPFLPENIEITISELKKRKIEVCCLGTSVMLHNTKNHEAIIQEGLDAIDLASQLGTPYIRVFGDRITDNEDKKSALKRISDGLNTFGKHCEGKNVIVLLETHGQFNSVETISPLFDMLDSDNIGILWDIEHTFKVYGDEGKFFFDRFKSCIKHTHFKDVKKTENGFDLCLVGNGDIPIKKIIELLKTENYDGYLSLEWEKKWHPELEEPEIAIPAYIEYIRSLF